MIHNFSSNAFPWYRTVGFVGTLAVTAGVLISSPFHEDLFVVCVDDGVHIRCTTVAEFQSFSVQDLVQVMVFGEIFVYEFKVLGNGDTQVLGIVSCCQDLSTKVVEYS